MLDFSKDRPATLNDIEQLLNAVCSGNFWLKSEEYRKLIGLGKTQFYYLKKIGKFSAGILKSTLFGKRARIHKFFNYHSQRIEWFGTEKITCPHCGGKFIKPLKWKIAAREGRKWTVVDEHPLNCDVDEVFGEYGLPNEFTSASGYFKDNEAIIPWK